MKQRFEIFKENLKLIRSSNKKNVPYKLHVNRELISILIYPTLACSLFTATISDALRTSFQITLIKNII